jgi:hypothetical protein
MNGLTEMNFRGLECLTYPVVLITDFDSKVGRIRPHILVFRTSCEQAKLDDFRIIGRESTWIWVFIALNGCMKFDYRTAACDNGKYD